MINQFRYSQTWFFSVFNYSIIHLYRYFLKTLELDEKRLTFEILSGFVFAIHNFGEGYYF